MNIKLTKVKNWFFSNLQIITFSLLIFAIVLIIKQQNDINNLSNQVYSVDRNVDNLRENVEDVKSNLNSEIDDIKTAIIWSH